MHKLVKNKAELKIGEIYRIRCGWGWTRAKLLSVSKTTDKKDRYEWQDMNNKIFTFCSYDLDDTYKIIKKSVDKAG